MKIKGKAIFISVVLCLAFLLYLKVSATIEYSFMDDFMDDPQRTYCNECHAPDISSYTEVRGITASCMRGEENKTINGIGCHTTVPQPDNTAPVLGRSHPKDIEPKDEIREIIPDDLHLEDDELITCATCHNPRSDPISTVKWVGGTDYDDGYKTYFLRRRNIDSDLCRVCHLDKF